MTHCACCQNDATSHAWETPLCDAHFHAWWKEAPMPKDIEADAAKSPKASEVIERVVKCEYFPDQVILKPGVLEKYMIAWTRKWARSKVVAVAA